MVDYDVAKLQPHFPAYPVFCFIGKLIYAITGRYALAFSFIGGVSIFLTIFFLFKIAGIRNTSSVGLIAIFMLLANPLLWLMGNRYMPDAMGVGLVLASFYFTTVQEEQPRKIGFGFFLAGVLGGVRLSCLPILIPALLTQLRGRWQTLRFIAAGAAGVTVWLVPLIIVTGWESLVDVAETHSRGHFLEFGGTISSESGLELRLTKLFESIWADGFGLYWNGRHLITICTTVTLLGILIANWHTIKSVKRSSFLSVSFIGCVVYLIWIFCFQNVVYKSRHVLPLVPFLALFIAYACAKIVEQSNRILKVVLVIFLCCYGYVALHLVVQHKKPTAIAQIHQYLKNKQSDKLHVVSVPLIKYYLAAQGLQAVYTPIKTAEDLAKLDEKLDDISGLVVIGSPLQDRVPKTKKTFYHNPYVNRMWSELSVFEY
jgi:4-amino-4-deoxy-L-arabinose transferase-like glycosyltransferase